MIDALARVGAGLIKSRWAAPLAASALACALGLTAYRVVRTYHTPSKDEFSRHGHIDFHHGVYFPARGYREGYNPSSNAYVNAYPLRRPMALYSPAAPLVFLPLGCLTLPAGDILYFGINALLTGTAAYAALRISGIAVSPASLLALTAAIIVSRPGHINLALGQITLPLVLGSWAALEWGARRPGRAALGLCVAALKPTFGIPLLWLTFCRGNRRAALWGGLLSASIAALAAGIEVARSGWPQWLDDLRYAASFVETSQETIPTETWTRIDGMVLLARLANANPNGIATAAFAATVLLAGGYLTARLARRERADHCEACGLASSSSLAMCLITLVCVYHNFYDALLLTAPCLALATRRLGRHMAAWRRGLLAVLILIPFVNYASTRSFLAKFDLGSAGEALLTSANSVALWLALGIAADWGLRRRQFAAEDPC